MLQTLQAQLEKALDPLEAIEELKAVVDLKEEIDRGAYGVVKKVTVYGMNCAAKEVHPILISYANDEEFRRIKKSYLEECIKCSKLFHPNLVQFLGIYYPNKQAKLPWLVTELMDCSLTKFVEKYNKESISLFIKASIFCDISLGLQFLHARNIIHRDLSSNNVLLTKHLVAKIADLGVAKMIDPSRSRSHSVVPGTKDFLPPEVFASDGSNKAHYGKPIDIFSLGCIMIHVVTHTWPEPLPAAYYDYRLKQSFARLEIERRQTHLNQIQELPDLKIIIGNCLQDDPKLRPTATESFYKLQELKISYQKQSFFAGEKMNAVEFEKHLKLQNKKISEQLLEVTKVVQQAHKQLQVRTV